MSQQRLDLRRSIQMVRRRKKRFGATVALGLIIGAGYAVIKPPMLTSTTLVVLQMSAAQSNQSTSSGTSPVLATQEVIAGSVPVLAAALPHISPAISLQALENNVQVTSVAGSILSISATGSTAAQAEATANAVANSYIAYVGSSKSAVGHVPAQVLESATSATGTKLSEQVAIYALLGALVGAVVGFVAVVAIGRNDRRLVERDAIASSIAAPVLASVPVSQPTDAASWVRLIDEYEPEPVDAWRLSRLLQQFLVMDAQVIDGRRGGRSSVTVLSLSSDPSALALGPQLAAFAAAQGIPTALVVGPQQDVNVTATLRTACAASAQSASASAQPGNRRLKPLRLVAVDDANLGQLRAGFLVVVTVIDGKDPHVPDTLRTAATVLGVSAGNATAEELARVAAAAAAAGHEILGILVANPQPDDQTTGRVPRLAPALRRPLPTRVNGAPTEIRQ